MRIFIILTLYVLGPLLIIWLYGRFKVLSKAGTIVLAYALGILMSLSGLTSPSSAQAESIAACQDWLQNLCVPLAIPLMLFSADFKAWTKSLKKTFTAFFCGVAAACLSVVAAFLLFRNQGIPELDKAAGLMIGFYTGGTPNVASLNMALQPASETFLLVNTFEIFITFFLLAFLIAGGYRLIRRFLRYIPEREEGTGPHAAETPGADSDSFENYHGMLSRGNLKALLLPLGCSVAVALIAAAFSFLCVSPDYRVISIILIITTLAIALSFWKKLRQSPKMFEAGMYFILIFSIVVASRFQVSNVGAQAGGLLAFIAVVLCLCFGLHMLFSKWCRVDADLFTISAVGLIFSPPFVPTVASLLKSRRCLLSGIVVGLLGYATGTYLGVLIYMLLQRF
ncbi:MAG: DUF819 family protein [Bacteroides sp.]|nr:DUF819 family protein [Bacteroides sp.]